MPTSLENNYLSLQKNPYPGRGIICGINSDADKFFQIYWIMGRSANSRNRVFALNEDGSVRTKAFDESKLEDPSLIIYNPARNVEKNHIMTNGDQTDTIYEYIKKGNTFEEAIKSREFEPDNPNYTPRISAITKEDFSCILSINKTLNNNPDYPAVYFYHFKNFAPGTGRMITTYAGDGNPLPSFMGEPVPVPVKDSLAENLDYYWQALNQENRVSLLVKEIDMKSALFNTKIVNSHS